MNPRPVVLAGALALALVSGACGAPAPRGGAGGATAGATVEVTNCGESVRFPTPAKRVFVNDGNMIAMALAVGAQDQLVAVTSLQKDTPSWSRSTATPRGTCPTPARTTRRWRGSSPSVRT